MIVPQCFKYRFLKDSRFLNVQIKYEKLFIVFFYSLLNNSPKWLISMLEYFIKFNPEKIIELVIRMLLIVCYLFNYRFCIRVNHTNSNI